MLYDEGSPNAISFLGELTWDMNKPYTRGLIDLLYLTGNAATKKQIGDLYALHGQSLPSEKGFIFD